MRLSRATYTIPSLHSASPSGITLTYLVVSRTNPSQFLTGQNDKNFGSMVGERTRFLRL